MTSIDLQRPRLFVLDTNVLIHDPTAIFRFQEHDIFLPMIVLEELDAGKKGLSEIARNVRQITRFLDELIAGVSKAEIDHGIALNTHQAKPIVGNVIEAEYPCGKLYFQTHSMQPLSSEIISKDKPDNTILEVALTLHQTLPNQTIILVSKDINLRIKATVLGIRAEDYSNDQVLDDVNLLYSGISLLEKDFLTRHHKTAIDDKKDNYALYRIEGPDVVNWYSCQCLYTDDNSFEALVRHKESTDIAIVELVQNYRLSSENKRNVWGITARNREQNFALNLLMDPNIDFVSLIGNAGTGKTLLALAAGLSQVIDHNLYQEIIMTRVTVPVGDDIGFLPGTEEEKMTPWMGALMDNLEVLTKNNGGNWARAATADLLHNRIKIHSLALMRGRTFLNKYLILDEAQNLTPKQMKTLITRAGPGTKIVCLGNIAQIDTPYLTESSSGLTYVVDRLRNWDHSGHITLLRGERSRLADFASLSL
ncbi:phosphate starvation protein PhoH [Achromatium sp. WMS1]|nr:phosphate starvation protein PhoH [Achromatium sp. WMS1]